MFAARRDAFLVGAGASEQLQLVSGGPSFLGNKITVSIPQAIFGRVVLVGGQRERFQQNT
jgi:hypothetical protein